MFVRKKPNKSGSTSVVVVEKTPDHKQRIVKTIGCSRSEQEITQFVKQAEDYIIAHTKPELPFVDHEEQHLHDFLHSLNNSQIQVIGSELIFGTLYDRIGYNAIHNDMFRHLVICRLYNPGSKLRTVDYLARYLHQNYSEDRIYRFLDNLCYRKQTEDKEKDKEKKNVLKKERTDIKTLVEQISFAHTKQTVGGQIDICFYDMTTLYFEAASEDEIRRCGFSKDGKHSCPQIYIGLLVASGGNPIGYEIFEGNIAESKTFIPLVKRLAARFGFERPIVVPMQVCLRRRTSLNWKRKGTSIY